MFFTENVVYIFCIVYRVYECGKKMNKYFLTLFLIFTLCMNAFAAINTKEALSMIENNIFGYEYKNESDEKRIERIETNIYGEKKSGGIQKRLEAIQADSGIMFEEPKPVANNVSSDKKRQQDKKNNELKNMKEDSSVDYPIVDLMEEEIFHTSYKQENIYDRLSRLEKSVFNNTSDEDLNTRVDKLAGVIKPSKVKAPVFEQNYTEKQLDDYYNANGFETVNNKTLPFQLSALEEDLLRKSYSEENNARRLSRLEQKLFNRTFPNDADTSRMQRIKVAYEAKQNSYRYESNRRMQNVATATQFGSILLMILAMLL